MKRKVLQVAGIISLCTMICAGSNYATANVYASGAKTTTNASVSADKESQFEQKIKDGKYIEAINLYEEFSGDAVKETLAVAFLKEYMENTISEFAAGKLDKLSYDARYTTLSNFDNSKGLITNELATMDSKVAELSASKTYYKQARAYVASKQYAHAMTAYENVITDDVENYDKAQKEYLVAKQVYKKGILDAAADFADEESYDSAIEVLEGGLSIIARDSDFISKRTEYLGLKRNLEINECIDATNKCIARKDYKSAVTTVNSVFVKYPDSAELIALEAKCKNEYYSKAKDDAKTLFEAGNLDEAILTLYDCQNTIGEYGDIGETIAEYETYRPIDLLTVDTLKRNNVVINPGTEIYDNIGNKYYGYSSGCCSGASQVYLNEGYYSHFTGTFAIRDMYSNYDDEQELQIVGDNGMVLETIKIDPAGKPVAFDVDISKCNTFGIVWTHAPYLILTDTCIYR